MSPAAPTSEKGALRGGGAGWSYFIDEEEHAPNLVWPNNLPIYREMMTDAQVEALYRGTTLPIRRYSWQLDPNGASDQAVAMLAEDLNIPVRGEEATTVGRRKKRFSFGEHLKWGLDAIVFGHYFFEQVGEIDASGFWRLRKLAPRPPRIVSAIDTKSDGGLSSIQVPSSRNNVSVETITVDRLVAYVWDQEPGSWIGRSMLRSIYKNWLLKDRLIRVDLIKHDRAGAGIPTATAPPGASKPQMEAMARMAQSMRSDEEGGGVIPHGADLSLMGISGTVPDTWASIRGHNEEMANAWLSQVSKLGQTQTGSRALGEVLMPALNESQESIAGWFADKFNEHVIEDWVDWNFGEDAPAPRLVFDRPSDGALAVADLAVMVDKGLVEVDEEMETWLRQQYKMPEKGEPKNSSPTDSASQPSDPNVVAKSRRSSRVNAAEEPPSPSLPDRELRRKPYDHEIAAAVDFKKLDAEQTTRSEALAAKLKEAQAVQLDDLEKAIIAADNDPVKLANLEVEALGADDIEKAAKDAAKAGADGAKAEAKAQGVTTPAAAVIDGALLATKAEAKATLLAKSIAEAGGREAVRRLGPQGAKELAAQVKTYLNGLSDAFLQKSARGVVNTGLNKGRAAFMRGNGPVRVYASELLDDNTCEFCSAIDGTEFDSMDEAEQWYPSGFADCLGGDNCRGTLVGVYSDEAAPTLAGSVTTENLN